MIDRTTAQGGAVPGIVDSIEDLSLAYDSYKAGVAAGYHPIKPVATRCGGALYIAATPAYGDPVPANKCDTGLAWAQSSCISGAVSWQTVNGTTSPMNGYQKCSQAGINYTRCDGPSPATAMKNVLSETYVHMWSPNFAYPGVGTTDRTEGGTVTATGSPCIVQDAPANAFDNTTSTRWCLAAPTGSIMYAMGSATAITGYTVTSANDSPSRDPKDWYFQGCNGSCTVGSDTGWVTLDRRTGEVFKDRWHMKSFGFQNSTAYSQYRFKFSANAGDTQFLQMAEIQMFDANSGGTGDAGAGDAGAGDAASSLTFSATPVPAAIPDNTVGGITRSISASGVTSSGSGDDDDRHHPHLPGRSEAHPHRAEQSIDDSLEPDRRRHRQHSSAQRRRHLDRRYTQRHLDAQGRRPRRAATPGA